MNKKPEAGAEAPQKSDVALREEVVLQFWEKHDIFKQSLESPAGKKPRGDFVFYDGPPFATGLPHYGHLLAGTIKDAIPRFWTMQGYRVRRKWGWDCHGLPLENLIEKELGLATKRDIEEFGIQNFNEKARQAVLRYADDWRRIVPRMGRFVDMEDDYKTMDPAYTESVWWVFKTLHEKDLVYESFKSMHLCPRCGTTLSNFEVNQGYKDIKDIAVTVKLPLLDESGKPTDTSLLVWTTTPWTLPGNMAAAVHKEADYVKVKLNSTISEIDVSQIKDGHRENVKQTILDKEHYILAKDNTKQLGTDEYSVVKEFKGAELVGRSYEPPFPYHQDRDFEGKENAWKIYHAPYVELGDEGTGAVHLAPAYGEEDMELAKAHGIPIVHHVDEEGHFMDFVTDFAGQLVKPKDDDDAGVTHLDADIDITRTLKERGKLFKKENITHSYPHCWRCDTPLLNYATTSWFVEVTKIRDDLVKENQKVHWVPEHVGRSRFGKWLEGARDWAISRQRYWGAPLPIWRNPKTKEYKVFGSLAEMQGHVPKSGNTYLIMRHGEADSNVSHTISTDLNKVDPLTDTGREQIAKSIEKLKEKNIDIIITSPFSRTKETAGLVREGLGLDEQVVIVDERIQEIQISDDLQGKSWYEHRKFYEDFSEEFTKEIEEGGETRRSVQRRVGHFLYEIDKSYSGKNILIIGHVSSTFALGCAAEGADIERALEIKANREMWLENAEVKELHFVPLPHNDNFELDYHRPYIDQIELYEGETKLERVPDVFDCWFESGSMPYAETHYPFENLEVTNIEKGIRYPADFIAESIDQTRGWFYSLMVLGVALTGRSPYQNVITNGLVLAEDGKKMSKKLQNYPDPMELVARQGADSMRFYLLSSSIIKGEDLNFSEKEVQELQRKNIGRLHNVLAMYEQYAGESTQARSDSVHVLDRWIVARLNELVTESTAGFKNYELDKATRPVTDFIDDLSVWYLRRSRDRLKQSGSEAAQRDKEAALATLRHVLKTLAQVMAPSMPFYADFLWGRVREPDDARSVHLSAWPEAGKIGDDLLADMQLVREIVSKGLELRAKAGLKVRQPLQTLFVGPSYARIMGDENYIELIKDELNVKEIVEYPDSSESIGLDEKVTPELQAEGNAREFMRQVQDLRKKAGLSPTDRITLIVQTSDGGQSLVKDFQEDIKKTVGADDIVFGDAEGEEVVVGDHSFTVKLKKL